MFFYLKDYIEKVKENRYFLDGYERYTITSDEDGNIIERNDKRRFFMMTMYYDLIIVIFIFLFLVSLIFGLFSCLLFNSAVVYFLIYYKRRTLIYNVVKFYKCEQEFSTASELVAYLKGLNKYNEKDNDLINEIVSLLISVKKIKKESNLIYRSLFKGPFKQKLERTYQEI